jgi:hypothetical protein
MEIKEVVHEAARLMDLYSRIPRDMSREEVRHFAAMAARIRGLKKVLEGAPGGLQWLDDHRQGVGGSWD